MTPHRIQWTERDDLMTGRNSDGYSLQVRPKANRWTWSLRPPGGGYSVSQGTAYSKEQAVAAVESALTALMEEISRSHEERLHTLRENKKRPKQ